VLRTAWEHAEIGRNDRSITCTVHVNVTICNTDFIFLRPHKDRDMAPLDPDRFSVNQDAMIKLVAWAGNVTCSNRFLQGVITA